MPRSLEQRLAALAVDSDLDALASALNDKSNFVVARAAELIQKREAKELGPQLEAAFLRMMQDPDKTCAAKIAIARALDELDVYAEPAFLAGVKHVQMEPAFGGPVDVAPPLRGRCACALARMRYPQALEVAIDLLGDAESIARIGAAQALLCSGSHEAVLLLRLKIVAGDRENAVIAECMNSLLELAKEESIPFVARFLGSRERDLAEIAAVALGQTRSKSAFEILKATGRFHLAIAILRLPEAIDHLIENLDRHAVRALAIYRDDPQLRERVDKAITTASLRKVFDEEFKSRT